MNFCKQNALISLQRIQLTSLFFLVSCKRFGCSYPAGRWFESILSHHDITNSASVMMTGVAGDECAIGYIFLGSLNDTVKALAIEDTIENIEAGTYNVTDPFGIDGGQTVLVYILFFCWNCNGVGSVCLLKSLIAKTPHASRTERRIMQFRECS